MCGPSGEFQQLCSGARDAAGQMGEHQVTRMLVRLASEFGFHPEDEKSPKGFERGGEGVMRSKLLFQDGASGRVPQAGDE